MGHCLLLRGDRSSSPILATGMMHSTGSPNCLPKGGSVRVHTYVIPWDAGSAPNYDPPFVTLAVCKPRIRKRAQPGELVVAFAGQDLNRHEPHTVVWAGVVVEVLTFAQYWDDKRFQGKKPKRPNGSENRLADNFYKPANGDLV